MVVIYTDGGAKNNPGPGAWACILHYKDQKKILTGFEGHTTNNRMELKAAIEGLKALKYSVEVKIITDSQYMQKGMNEWLARWKEKGWNSAGKSPIKNQDLWQELDILCHKHHVSFVWTKGHAGNPGNEEADTLVRETLLQNIT